MEEHKPTEEGTSDEQNQHVDVSTTNAADDGPDEDARTVKEIESKKDMTARIKNLTSAVILLAGLLGGSLFVDAAQFFTASGYSERALKEAEIFEGSGKTWVAYADPIVQVQVLTVNDDEMMDCPKCDPTEVLSWLKRFVPTVIADRIDIESETGKALAAKYNVKTVPAFLFDKKMEDTEFYLGEAKVLFEERQDRFALNSSQLGVPVGKYLETPVIAEDDPVIGDREAAVQMVVLSDHECPYCKQFYNTITKVAKEYGNQVALTYKEFPLDIHKQAKTASMAALCANEQGKYWQMADILFGNQKEWEKTDQKDIFKSYAKRIGLNPKQYDECLDQEKYSDKIEKDMAIGDEYGIFETPSVFINDQFLSGVVQEAELKKMIDEELHN